MRGGTPLHGAHSVQRAARPRCGARSSELQAALRVGAEVLTTASASRVGTLRGRTAIILLAGFPGAKMKLQYMPMDNEACFPGTSTVSWWTSGRGLWAGALALDGAWRDHWRAARTHRLRSCALGE